MDMTMVLRWVKDDAHSLYACIHSYVLDMILLCIYVLICVSIIVNDEGELTKEIYVPSTDWVRGEILRSLRGLVMA